MRVKGKTRDDDGLTVIFRLTNGTTHRIRMPGDNLGFCRLAPLYLGNDPETGIVRWRAVGSRCIGLTRLHNGHADTVFCAVVTGVPGCQGVGTDAPGIGYGHICANVAVRVTSRARIARRDMRSEERRVGK